MSANSDMVARLLFFTSCTFTLSVHSDFMQHRQLRGAFFCPMFPGCVPPLHVSTAGGHLDA
ncbi:hypothetical protein FCH33_03525 [Serratia fonticola]|nr:hypothetical protein [Serratia fonticola]NTZ11738.1 hypothetical protein [Serratia fonticola]